MRKEILFYSIHVKNWLNCRDQNHSVEITEIPLTLFNKKFVKLTFFEKLQMSWFFTKYFFIEREFLIFPHCTRNFCITWELFRKINFTVILFTKKFVFTENFSKTLDTKISLINCQMRWSSLLHVKMFVNFVTDILLCVTFLISRKCWKSSKYRTF